VGDLNAAVTQSATFGSTTAAISAAGESPSDSTEAGVEEWNGSAWTEVTSCNTGRNSAAGSGITTSGLIFGGQTAPTTYSVVTESYNGSSWTEVADLATARYSLGSSERGPSTTTLAFGGRTGSHLNSTEEWSTTHTLKKVTLA
jgi:hypothetical protein